MLELLAAICLVKGGHEIILNAFDNFKSVMSEKKRFKTMMHYFQHPDQFQIDFMVACMQFINIVVHSVADMNFRVALQWEFSSLGLGDYLEKLQFDESEELAVQIKAYIDNQVQVSVLLEELDDKNAIAERVTELEDDLGRANELVAEYEVRMNFLQV